MKTRPNNDPGLQRLCKEEGCTRLAPLGGRYGKYCGKCFLLNRENKTGRPSLAPAQAGPNTKNETLEHAIVGSAIKPEYIKSEFDMDDQPTHSHQHSPSESDSISTEPMLIDTKTKDTPKEADSRGESDQSMPYATSTQAAASGNMEPLRRCKAVGCNEPAPKGHRFGLFCPKCYRLRQKVVRSLASLTVREKGIIAKAKDCLKVS